MRNIPKPKKLLRLAFPWLLPRPKKLAREELCLPCLSSPPKIEREEEWCLSDLWWCLSSVTPKMEAAIPGRCDEERLWWPLLRDEERERERCLLWCLEWEELLLCLEWEWEWEERPETIEAASSRRPILV